jgi:hypothetical protein
MRKVFNILKVSDSMHHCSSICEYNEKYVIAFYHGQECSDEQRVSVCFCDESGILKFINLEYGTGNPIVWNDGNKCMLMYSKFTDTAIPNNHLVMKWMYCDNYLAEIVNMKIQNVRKIDGAFGLLARCQPINVEGKILIPLYREQNPNCQIWSYNKDSLSKISEFGNVDSKWADKNRITFGYMGDGVAIQPSIFRDKNRIIAFCRNVSMDFKNAWISISDLSCKNWSEIKQTNIPNEKNTLVVFPYFERTMMVFNNEKTRSQIFLHDFKIKLLYPLGLHIANPKSSMSYPNYLCDSQGRLHIVHTNCGRIAWHIMDKDYLDEIFNKTF